MSLKQNILAVIAALLFSITMALMDSANTAALAANLSPSASTAPSVNNTFSEARDPVSASQHPAQHRM